MKGLSEISGFLYDSLLAYIMTGFEPVARRLVEYTILKNLTRQDLNLIAKRMRQVTVGNGKNLTERHERLYNFMQEQGPIPKNKKMMFWRDAFRKWRDHYPNDEIKSAGSLRKACLRLFGYLRRKGIFESRKSAESADSYLEANRRKKKMSLVTGPGGRKGHSPAAVLLQ
jgi:hypothetical protein